MQGRNLMEWIRSSPDVLRKSKMLLDGQEIEFGVPDGGLVRKKLKRHIKAGAEALKDFEEWMIRHESMNPDKAETYRKYVWNVLCLTWSDPQQRPEPEVFLTTADYSMGSLLVFTAALKRWAIYSRDATLLTEVARVERASRKRHRYIVGDDPDTDPRFFNDDEFRRLIESTFVFRGDPRWPWAWSVLGIYVKSGLFADTLAMISKDDVEQAISEPHVIRVWRKTTGARLIPALGFKDELEALLRMPLEWNHVADVVAPVAKSNKRQAAAKKKINKLITMTYDEAGLGRAAKDTYKLQRTVALKLWTETKNLIGVSQFLGKPIDSVRAILGDHILDGVEGIE